MKNERGVGPLDLVISMLFHVISGSELHSSTVPT
jgi:hypothetical protein